MTAEKKVICVFGSSAPPPGSADYEAARTVGRLLAEAGYAVQTGGYAGVMAAASQGAGQANGHVIGVTSTQIEQFRPTQANQWVAEEIKCKSLRDRVLYLVANCDGVIAMPGGVGTLSELALVWSLVQVGEIPAKPIIAVGGLWQRTLAAFIDPAYVPDKYKKLVAVARTPREAVKQLVEQLKGSNKK